MTYINQNPDEDILGYTPVGYKGWPAGSTQNFAQVMIAPGSLKDPVYPGYGLNNSQSMGSSLNFGNVIPNFPSLNLFSPLATTFNINLPTGGGGSTTVVGDGTWINVTGSGSPYTVSFDTTGLCSYISSNCTVPGFSDPYYNTMIDQSGDSVSGTTQPSSFRIIGDWVDGGGGGADTGFIETDLNASGHLEILFRRKMWERIYDGGGGEAFPTTSSDEFIFQGDGSYISSSVNPAGSCTYSLDINAVATATDQFLFSTIVSDNGGNIEADSTTDTLTFAYDVDGGDYDNSIVITNDPTTDTIKFKLDMDVVQRSAPSTCMVLLVSQAGVSSPPGFSLAITGMKYLGSAFITDFDASTNTTTVTNETVDLWDLGYNEGAGWVADSSGLFVDDPAPATITEQISLAGQWVMATRIHPAYGANNAAYVTSYFPRLKSECAGSTP